MFIQLLRGSPSGGRQQRFRPTLIFSAVMAAAFMAVSLAPQQAYAANNVGSNVKVPAALQGTVIPEFAQVMRFGNGGNTVYQTMGLLGQYMCGPEGNAQLCQTFSDEICLKAANAQSRFAFERATLEEYAANPQLAGQNISLKNGNLAGAPLKNGNLAGAPLKNGNLAGAPLKNGNLAGAPLKNGNLAGAPLKNGNLAGQPTGRGGTGVVDGQTADQIAQAALAATPSRENNIGIRFNPDRCVEDAKTFCGFKESSPTTPTSPVAPTTSTGTAAAPVAPQLTASPLTTAVSPAARSAAPVTQAVQPVTAATPVAAAAAPTAAAGAAAGAGGDVAGYAQVVPQAQAATLPLGGLQIAPSSLGTVTSSAPTLQAAPTVNAASQDDVPAPLQQVYGVKCGGVGVVKVGSQSPGQKGPILNAIRQSGFTIQDGALAKATDVNPNLAGAPLKNGNLAGAPLKDSNLAGAPLKERNNLAGAPLKQGKNRAQAKNGNGGGDANCAGGN